MAAGFSGDCMSSDYNKFIDSLIMIYPEVEPVYIESINYWFPEYPPKVLLLANFGHLIALNYDSFSENQRNVIFAIIEDAMSSSSEELKVAVATGLVEAMVGASDNDEELWQSLKECFGGKTLLYAESWRNFSFLPERPAD